MSWKTGLFVSLSGAAVLSGVLATVFEITYSQRSSSIPGVNWALGNRFNVRNAGTVFTFDSFWAWGPTGAKRGTWHLYDPAAKVYVDPVAIIDQQMDDSVNARTMYINHGDADGGTAGSVELDPAFQADHGVWDDAEGFSTVYFGPVTFVTHHMQRLPTIWKKTRVGTATHHGVVHFCHPAFRWEVKTNAQAYDGQVDMQTPWTLHLEKDLLFDGFFHTGANVAWWCKGVTLTKTGPGALVLAGTLGHRAGSRYEVQKGALEFRENPDQAIPFDNTTGPYLQLEIGPEATVRFETPLSGLQALTCSGTLSIGATAEAEVEVSQDVSLAAQSFTDLYLGPPSSLALMRVGGTLAQGGTLRIHNRGSMAPGAYNLFDATSFAGDFQSLQLPDGFQGQYDPATGQLTLSAGNDETPPKVVYRAVELTGAAGATVVSVKIRDHEVLDPLTHTWRAVVDLGPDPTEVAVIATDGIGNTTTLLVRISLAPLLRAP